MQPFSKKNLFTPSLLIVVCWAIFILWRITQLGFYHDDWSLLTVTSSYGENLIAGGRTRPLNVALCYLGVVVFQTNALAWHLYGALLVLAASYSIYAACLAVGRHLALHKDAAVFGALVAACSWMLFPWGFGYSAWPVMFPGLVCVLLFAQTIRLLAESPVSTQNLRWACYCVVACSLIYEAFWFAFAPLAVLAYACTDNRIEAKKIFWKIVVVVGTVQLAMVAWNFLLAFWGSGGGKQVDVSWVTVASVSIRLLAVIAVSAGGALLISWRIGKRERRMRTGMAITAIACGIFVTGALYASAGYPLAPWGVASRTFLAVNVWLALSIAISAAIIFDFAGYRLRRLLVPASLLFLILLGLLSVRETKKWAESWSFQQALLKELPIKALEQLQESSAVIFMKPARLGAVESLEAPWDTAAAMYVTQPSLRQAVESRRLWVTASRDKEQLTTWKDGVITQYWCAHPTVPLWQYNASRVYIVTESHTLETVKPGWSHHC